MAVWLACSLLDWKDPGSLPAVGKLFHLYLLETASVETGVPVKSNRTSQHFGRCIRLHVLMSRREGRREGERDTVKGRMIKRSLRAASVLRYSTRTKHYKLNRIWAFGIRNFRLHGWNAKKILKKKNGHR